VSEEFLSGVVYGANIVVTNPTSTPQKLSLLLQIPKGALPVLGSKATDSKTLRLEAYTTKTFESKIRSIRSRAERVALHQTFERVCTLIQGLLQNAGLPPAAQIVDIEQLDTSKNPVVTGGRGLVRLG